MFKLCGRELLSSAGTKRQKYKYQQHEVFPPLQEPYYNSSSPDGDHHYFASQSPGYSPSFTFSPSPHHHDPETSLDEEEDWERRSQRSLTPSPSAPPEHLMPQPPPPSRHYRPPPPGMTGYMRYSGSPVSSEEEDDYDDEAADEVQDEMQSPFRFGQKRPRSQPHEGSEAVVPKPRRRGKTTETS